MTHCRQSEPLKESPVEPTDKTEKGIRFGCGFIFGLFLFGFSAYWFITEGRSLYVILVLSAAVVLGLAAMVFGDAFWRWISRWLSWLPWG